MKINEQFGKTIKEAKKKKGLKAKQIYTDKRINVSKTTFSNWESGKMLPHLNKLEALFDLLDIEIHFEPAGNVYSLDNLLEVVNHCPDLGEELRAALLYCIRIRKRDSEQGGAIELGDVREGRAVGKKAV